MSLRRPLLSPRGDLVAGAFVLPSPADGAIDAVSPADLDDTIGRFPWAISHVERALDAARSALPAWRRAAPEVRATHLRAYRDALGRHRDAFVVAIARAIGKPLWEARTELDAMVAKVDITLGAGLELVAPRALPDGSGAIRYRPVGVCAVLGPFNFPGHLPNGHIVPALATGNVVVFKPSEKAPEVGELMARCFDEAGFPAGVVQVLQGGSEVARALVASAGVDAVMFTGSTPVGRSILEQSARFPGRLVALEMGGKNSAIVLADANVAYAAREIAFAAYVTAGQRCTATSRVLVERAVADELVQRLTVAARETRVGVPDGDDVFLGPVVNEGAMRAVLDATRALPARYEAVAPARAAQVDGVRGYYLAPALYRVGDGAGEAPGLEVDELFAPLITLEVVASEADAVARANATRYGLAASVYTASRERFERLAPELDAGVCNWNRGTVGSSSKLPFGGVKDSGNHRPAGLFSSYYCVDAVAEIRVEAPSTSAPLPPGLRVG